MGPSASLHKNQTGTLQLFILFTLALSYLSLVIAVPTESSAVNQLSDSAETRGFSERALSLSIAQRASDALLTLRTPSSQELQARQRDGVGLMWGPIPVGNLQLSMTNPHEGPCGPKFPSDTTPHVNFHVDKKGPRLKYVPVVNLHIVKYSSTKGKTCLYAWDSVTKKLVFDNCFDNWAEAIPALADAAKNFVDALLKAADFFAAVAILAVLVIVITTAVEALAVVALAAA